MEASLNSPNSHAWRQLHRHRQHLTTPPAVLRQLKMYFWNRCDGHKTSTRLYPPNSSRPALALHEKWVLAQRLCCVSESWRTAKLTVQKPAHAHTARALYVGCHTEAAKWLRAHQIQAQDACRFHPWFTGVKSTITIYTHTHTVYTSERIHFQPSASVCLLQPCVSDTD